MRERVCVLPYLEEAEIDFCCFTTVTHVPNPKRVNISWRKTRHLFLFPFLIILLVRLGRIG